MWNKSAIIITRFGYRAKLSLRNYVQTSTAPSYLHNPGSEPLTYTTLGDVIAEVADQYPGRVAVRSVYEDQTLTYEELLTKADILGCALRSQGLEKGDRVGIWSHNNAAYLITLVAAARTGLISALINPVYEKSELSFCLKKVGVKSLIVGERLPNRNYYDLLYELIPNLRDSKAGFLKTDAFPCLSSVITAGKEKLPGIINLDSLVKDFSNNEIGKYSTEVKPEDGSIILFTSGSTGDPKAALESHHGVANHAYFMGKRLSFHNGHQKICLQAPLFHALGCMVTTLSGLRHGASLVMGSPTYNISANFNTVVAENCTAVTGTPTMFVDMMAQGCRKGVTPSHLQMALVAGAPCSPQLIKDMQKYLKAGSVMTLYGLTESTASIFQSLPEDSIDMVAETVGYIQDHVEVKVVDENGETVPFGTAGELMSRGYNNMICYWDEPEKTKDTIDKDGWLLTGDKFTISPDGYGRIVGRLKDIIVRGGENIAPKEIEDLLNTHPDIVESQVIGVPDERLGEDLCAVLRLREGATITDKDIAQFCLGKLARYKIPRLLKIADNFPKTASGKIQKHKLRDMVNSRKL